jgi:4-amino-4-deoxy-L-arabinose transferase-like glycosyltransferase
MQRPGFWNALRAQGGLAAILVAALALRLYKFNAPADDFLSWRETVTLMVARNFYRFGMNPFLPRVDWSLPGEPAAVHILGGSELMVTPYLTAMLYHIAGITNWAGRVFPILFSLIGLFVFHRFAERLFDRRAAHIATIFLAVSPYYLYCGRTQQPESFAHTMAIVALFTFHRLTEKPGAERFTIAALSAAGMMLGKPTMGVLAIPMVFMLFQAGGVKRIIAPSTWAFGASVGVPVTAFLYWSFIGLDALTPVNLGGEGWYFAHDKWLTSSSYYRHIGASLFMSSLTPLVFAGAFVGALAAIEYPPFRAGTAWLAGALSMFLIIPGGAETNGYYQMLVEPPACLLAGAVVSHGLFMPRVRWAAAAAVPLVLLNSLWVARLLYAPVHATHVACGRWVDANTPNDATVLTANQSTTTLYYANRPGWTSWPKSLGPHPQFGRELVDKVRANGATVVAIPFPGFDNAYQTDFDGVREYLYTNYRVYKAPEFTVFRLDQPPDLSLPPGGRVMFGELNTRKYLRGAVGPDTRLGDIAFVPVGPGKEAAIEFDSPAEVSAVFLYLASTTPDHQVMVRVNDGEPQPIHFEDAGVRMVFEFSPIPAPVPGNRYRVDIQATQANEQQIGLVLFEMRAIAGG